LKAKNRPGTTPEDRIRILLPAEYQERYEDIQPVSMGSAGLKFGADGRVGWDEMWRSFCDLAMAGGPPHRGALLEPGLESEISAEPARYREVVEEICRGIRMVTELAVSPSLNPGWVSVGCDSATMANWLARAITMENVSAWFEDSVLELPAGPGFRIEKEIKNVITSLAKTNHYFADHLRRGQQQEIEALFAEMDAEAPLVQAASFGHGFSAERDPVLRDAIAVLVQAKPSAPEYAGWVGVALADQRSAIRGMRLLGTVNVVARRESSVLYLPVNPLVDPDGNLVASAVRRILANQ